MADDEWKVYQEDTGVDTQATIRHASYKRLNVLAKQPTWSILDEADVRFCVDNILKDAGYFTEEEL